MDNDIKSFFGALKAVSLSKEEKASVRSNLLSQLDAVERHLQASASQLSLTEEEKDESYHRLYNYIKRHPVKDVCITSSFFEKMGHFLAFHRLVAASVIIAILVSSGGVVTYAAEDTVPGDLLYPVKTRFTEPLWGAFQFTPERRAQWEVTRMERRMKESEHMARNMQLTPDHQQFFADRMEHRIEMMEEHLAVLESSGSIHPMRDQMEQMLQHYEEMLEQFQNGEVELQDLGSMLRRMKDARQRMMMRHGRPPGPPPPQSREPPF